MGLTRNFIYFSTVCAGKAKWKQKSCKSSAYQQLNFFQHDVHENWKLPLEQKTGMSVQY